MDCQPILDQIPEWNRVKLNPPSGSHSRPCGHASIKVGYSTNSVSPALRRKEWWTSRKTSIGNRGSEFPGDGSGGGRMTCKCSLYGEVNKTAPMCVPLRSSMRSKDTEMDSRSQLWQQQGRESGYGWRWIKCIAFVPYYLPHMNGLNLRC